MRLSPPHAWPHKSQTTFMVFSIPSVGKKDMSMELALIIAVVVGWFILNRWLLPKMGVST